MLNKNQGATTSSGCRMGVVRLGGHHHEMSNDRKETEGQGLEGGLRWLRWAGLADVTELMSSLGRALKLNQLKAAKSTVLKLKNH